MKKRIALVVTSFAICLFVVISCSDVPDSHRATEIFADCLERNGVDGQDLVVTLNPDGSVESISVTIVSESDVPYEPTVRMACTEEVELEH